MSKLDTDALLRDILRRADELRLSDMQFKALSQLYFRGAEPVRFSEVESAISPDQLRMAFRQALLAEPANPASAGAAANPDVAVASLIEDSTALEIELSGRVAERLMKWAKIFGIFVAVPVAVVTAVLAWYGITDVADVRKVASNAEVQLASAQAQVTASVSDARSAASKAETLVTTVNVQLASVSTLKEKVQGQLAQLQTESQNNASKIQQLDCRTQAIEQSLGKGVALLESGQLDPGLVTQVKLPGGRLDTEYGPFTLEPYEVSGIAFSAGTPWANTFQGTKPGDNAFDAAWQAAGKNYPEVFFNAQRQFVKQTVYDPEVALILKPRPVRPDKTL